MTVQPTTQKKSTAIQVRERGVSQTTSDEAHEQTNRQKQTRQVVTIVFVRLSQIPGSEPGSGALADEMAEYRRVIDEVGASHRAIKRLLNASSALLLFPAEAILETPSLQGIEAAISLRQRLQALNRQRLGEQRIPFRIGIGVHTEILPDFMDNQQRRLSALQHSIQEAEGLSLLNWQAPFPAIFVSKSALRGLGSRNGYNVQNLGEAFAPNQEKAMTVYAVM